MANTNIRILLVDDEPLARKRLRELLKGEPDLEIVGEASTGSEALVAVRELAPDLLFLDVQIPELDGLAVSEALKTETGPLIIFVTAYDQYAVRAFDVQAVDYLLKPFDRQRFLQALMRAKTQLQEHSQQTVNQRILGLLAELKQKPQHLTRVIIKVNERDFVLNVTEIDWIEAEGNYVRLHFGGQSSLIRETLSHLASQLDPTQFARIHRSRLVNLNRIQELQTWSQREAKIILRNGTELSLARSYRDQLYQLLGKL